MALSFGPSKRVRCRGICAPGVPDLVNDHCALRVILREVAIGEMPPLEALWRLERLQLAKWKDRHYEWRTKVK